LHFTPETGVISVYVEPESSFVCLVCLCASDSSLLEQALSVSRIRLLARRRRSVVIFMISIWGVDELLGYAEE
jgi:hypothetical protein